MRYNTFIIIGLFLLLSCRNYSEKNQVYYYGALKNFMHKGDISAKIDLRDLKSIPNLYAIGAAEDLKGEILILDSQPMITFVQDDQLKFDPSYNQKASLLVYASVPEWNSFVLPDSIISKKQLEDFVEIIAGENNINTDEPFPFIVKGKVASANWHVIDWDVADSVHTHVKHKNSGLNGVLQKTGVSILGFYSKHHHTIFTHHTTNIHLHVSSDDNSIAGHLDDVVLSKGMILKLMKH